MSEYGREEALKKLMEGGDFDDQHYRDAFFVAKELNATFGDPEDN